MGGSSSGVLLMASPKLTSGSYTMYTGATVSGGENFNGLYTSIPNVSSSGTAGSTVTVK